MLIGCIFESEMKVNGAWADAVLHPDVELGERKLNVRKIACALVLKWSPDLSANANNLQVHAPQNLPFCALRIILNILKLLNIFTNVNVDEKYTCETN